MVMDIYNNRLRMCQQSRGDYFPWLVFQTWSYPLYFDDSINKFNNLNKKQCCLFKSYVFMLVCTSVTSAYLTFKIVSNFGEMVRRNPNDEQLGISTHG